MQLQDTWAETNGIPSEPFSSHATAMHVLGVKHSRSKMIPLLLLVWLVVIAVASPASAQPTNAKDLPATASSDQAQAIVGSWIKPTWQDWPREAIIRFIAYGGGLLPGQSGELSRREIEFRQQVEQRKTRMLSHRDHVAHPVLISPEQIERARRNVQATQQGQQLFQEHKDLADYVIAQDEAWIDQMVPKLTPWHNYGFTCPNCVGDLSQEAAGNRIVHWDYRRPDQIACKKCGQIYPSAEYPETAILKAPRMGQTLTFYLNEEERAHLEDRSGKYAYQWSGHPIHVSFTGEIRSRKARFMLSTCHSLAAVYRLTDDPAYAKAAVKILLAYASAYRQWLYHDYWDTVADCDPLFAAWHDGHFQRGMKLPWKRQLTTSSYPSEANAYARVLLTSVERASQGDSIEAGASMLQSYFGAGRLHPSTDGIRTLRELCIAYDLLHDAVDANGESLWTAGARQAVERDLFLEAIIGSEPYVGGIGQAKDAGNKGPRVYLAQAAVGKLLGIPELADVALQGYELIRDRAFLFDGFTWESPNYMGMYLFSLLPLVEQLQGFTWPEDFPNRSGRVDLFGEDVKLRAIMTALVDQLRPDGRVLPLSDSTNDRRPSVSNLEVGLHRYPEIYADRMGILLAGRPLTNYSLWNIDLKDLRPGDSALHLPEIFFPAWMTAILRHGKGPDAAVAALANNPIGGHRQWDNLSLYYGYQRRDLLADLGKVGNMPQDWWGRLTQCHNLVVVNDTKQLMKIRRPRMEMVFTTPDVSVVEASSNAYKQCDEYRRLVALVKGPEGRNFLLDIFRVTGGEKHAFRVGSGIGASDADGYGREFIGIDMPQEPPYPDIGGSQAKEYIFGLRDPVVARPNHPGWQAIWRQDDAAYRMWMLSPADQVVASHGPGQQTKEQIGRRLRYLDVVREGANLQSTFVAVHEPSGANGAFPVTAARLLDVPDEAGPDALAVELNTRWGNYLVLSEFDAPAEVAGVRFSGKFGMIKTDGKGLRTLIACRAEEFVDDGFGFEGAPAAWTGQIIDQQDAILVTSTPKPIGFADPPAACQQYVLTEWGELRTALRIMALKQDRITVSWELLPEMTSFELPALRVIGE